MSNNLYLLQTKSDHSFPSKSLLEYTHFGYMWTTVKTHKIVASHTVYALLELEPFSEFLNEDKWRSFIHPLDLYKLLQAQEILLETGEPCNCEYRIISKSGKHIYINHHMRLSISQENEIKILSILDDITEQKHAEVLLEIMNEGFCELDNFYCFRRINAKAESLWSITRNNVIGKNIWEVFPDATETAFYTLITTAVEEKKNVIQDVAGPVNNHWLHFSATPFNDGAIIIFYDIQNEREAEEKVLKAQDALLNKNKELEQRNKELLSLSKVAGHDLKEPLRKIYTAVEAIITSEAQKLSNNGRAHLRRLQSSVQKMGLITDDLLSFTSITENEKEFFKVDLNEVLNEAKKRLDKFIVENNAHISSAGLPGITGNFELLVTLFKHIIHNAIKFQQNNIAEVSIESQEINLNGKGYLQVSFKDNGIGFNQQHADEIFNLFTKLNALEQYHGSGMGLAICKRITEQHNGSIHAVSEEGKGTRIICTFALI